MPETIRDIIKTKAQELKEADDPNTVADILKDLFSLLASINKECAERKYWLALKRIGLLTEHGTVAKANMYAEGSKEYQNWMEAEEYRKATIEMIRACKYFLRNASGEYKLT